MAVVQGIKEKVHLPIYDCLRVKSEERLGKDERSNTWKFFVDVQGKTKLETNLQAASLLPHYNTFEARAMRVVISDLPAEYPDDIDVEMEGLDVVQEDGTPVAGIDSAKVTIDLKTAMEMLEEARESDEGTATLPVKDDEGNLTDGVELKAGTGGLPNPIPNDLDIEMTVADLKGAIEDLETKAPAPEQISPNNGAGTLVGKVVYNTVTSLYVGEKVMIEMPTWFFPGGAGPYSEQGKFTTHGEPSPISTFKFAEPIHIDKNQNFRVEMEIPDSDVLKDIQRIYGPFFIWVVLDGFMTRDVQ